MAQIIVSFTSYPARIKTVEHVLDSLVKQTILPDRVILYLSSEQFSEYKKMPDFRVYKEFRFEVCWHREDLGPHKKYFYVMQQYPDDIIITIDDDIYYNNTMIEELLHYHKKYPKAVITRRAHLVTWIQENKIAPYENWYKETIRYVGIPRMDLVPTGCAGILYPPHLFDTEIFNKKVFMEKAPYADDLWLKLMELYSDIPVVLTKVFFDDQSLEDYSENGLYCNQNANGGNDIQLRALLDTYDFGINKKLLLNRLASQGKLMVKDCEKVKKNDVMFFLDEYFKIIDNQRNVLIYGAGNVAGKVCDILKKTGRINKILAFIVNCTEKNEKEIYGIKVKNYKEFVGSSEKIIIGLCEVKQEEIYRDLIVEGFREERIIKLSPFINKLIALS